MVVSALGLLPVWAGWTTYESRDELDDKTTYGCATADTSGSVTLYVMKSGRPFIESQYAYVYVAPKPYALSYAAGAVVGTEYSTPYTVVPFRWRVDKGEVHQGEGDQRELGFGFLLHPGGLEEWINGSHLVIRYKASGHDDDITVTFSLAGSAGAIRWLLAKAESAGTK